METPSPQTHLETVLRSRRTFLLGGLGLLAACGSATTLDGAVDDNAIVLGGEEPTTPSGDTGATSETTQATDSAAPAVDPAAPTPTPDPSRSPIEQVSFDYLDGGTGTLADYVGTPLVINFFAKWCAPCAEELPHFEEISQKYADQVRFLGFSVTDTPETTRELLAETGVTFDVAMDPEQSIHRELGGFAMPTTIFVDRYGNLATGRFGAIRREDLENLIIEELL